MSQGIPENYFRVLAAIDKDVVSFEKFKMRLVVVLLISVYSISPIPIQTIKADEIAIISQLPFNDQIVISSYCKQKSHQYNYMENCLERTYKASKSGGDYKKRIQIIMDIINQGAKPELIEFPGGFNLTSLYGTVKYSANGGYIGVALTLIPFETIPGGILNHYVLLNSSGKILWEMEHSIDSSYDFPADKMWHSNEFFVTNQGNTLILRDKHPGLNNRNKYKTGWILFSKDGRVIYEKQNCSCRYPVQITSKNLFIIQEKRNRHRASTNAYNFKGQLIWKNKEILPIEDYGYQISPSGTKILALLKDGNCIFDPDGDFVSYVKGFSEGEHYFIKDIVWIQDEGAFICQDNFFKLNFLPWKNGMDITEKFEEQCGILYTKEIKPISMDMYLCVGFKIRGTSGRFYPTGQHKFIGLIDRNLDLVGIRFISTSVEKCHDLFLNTDPINQTFCFSTYNEVITGVITSDKTENVFTDWPPTPTPTPSIVPRPTRTPLPPGTIGWVSLDEEYWGYGLPSDIHVMDPDLNQDPVKQEICIIRIISDSDPEGIEFTLREKSINSPRFFNKFNKDKLWFTPGKSIEGKCIHVQNRDKITVIYKDQFPMKTIKASAIYHQLEYFPPVTEKDFCRFIDE